MSPFPPLTPGEQQFVKAVSADLDAIRAAHITAARQRLAELLDADTYDCATLHTAARELLNALER